MASPNLSFSAEDTMIENLDKLALATGQNREQHLRLALQRYLEAELSCLREIDEGIADAEAGRLTDLEIVKAKWVARADNSVD
jgi:predicted transcriptional regulator